MQAILITSNHVHDVGQVWTECSGIAVTRGTNTLISNTKTLGDFDGQGMKFNVFYASPATSPEYL
ncbi:MAG: hypothetical protein HN348_35275 [Proteobacteria bacterium]|jgi:hypothetical protein|nr:hypothetical protein [Pseudomonadota bacterium]